MSLSRMAASQVKVLYKFRDRNEKMFKAWMKHFEKYSDRVQITQGDIFTHAPSADAIVSPANSFGFMDGGIDMAYSRHFGWQMQTRLQKYIKEELDGELLVGQAVIIPTLDGDHATDDLKTQWTGCNQNQVIKYLISAPTMRVPEEIPHTVNAFLAFRAVILAVQKHNSTNPNELIQSVLTPGLGTAVGKLPHERCAYQMAEAFRVYDLGEDANLREPSNLRQVWDHHESMQGHRD